MRVGISTRLLRHGYDLDPPPHSATFEVPVNVPADALEDIWRDLCLTIERCARRYEDWTCSPRNDSKVPAGRG